MQTTPVCAHVHCGGLFLAGAGVEEQSDPPTGCDRLHDRLTDRVQRHRAPSRRR